MRGEARRACGRAPAGATPHAGRRGACGGVALGCAALLLGPSCVIPVGPEFEADPNLSPFIVMASPEIGTIQTRTPDAQRTFILVVDDPNPRDQLFVRWVFDYPPIDENTRVGEDKVTLDPSPDGSPRRTTFEPNCTIHALSSEVNPHRLQAIVSDREFLNPEETGVSREFSLTAVPPGAHRVIATWTLFMNCPR
jgi:hypothetical protein